MRDGGIAPDVAVEMTADGALVHLTVTDNGPGIAPETVERLLNFRTRLSDKAICRAPPWRPGERVKTVLGMPFAFGLRDSRHYSARLQHTINGRD